MSVIPVVGQEVDVCDPRGRVKEIGTVEQGITLHGVEVKLASGKVVFPIMWFKSPVDSPTGFWAVVIPG